MTSGHAAIAEKRGFRLIMIAARPESAPYRVTMIGLARLLLYPLCRPWWAEKVEKKIWLKYLELTLERPTAAWL